MPTSALVLKFCEPNFKVLTLNNASNAAVFNLCLPNFKFELALSAILKYGYHSASFKFYVLVRF